MAEVQINLPDSATAFADAQVAAGRFSDLSAYLGALVSADQVAQSTLRRLDNNPQLAKLLEEGLDSGPGRVWTPLVLEEMKQQVLNRAAGSNS